MSDAGSTKQTPEESLKDLSVQFLSKEYEFACSQMKYYDGAIFDYLKYLFIAYTAIISVVGILEKLGVSGSANYLLASELLLFTGFCIGVIIVIMIMKTRLYFVVVARYANNLRKFFLEKQDKALNPGFKNESHMWADPKIPHYAFSLNSAHTWILIIPIILNAIVFSVLIYLMFMSNVSIVPITAVVFIIIMAIQIIPLKLYPNSKNVKKTLQILLA